MAISVHVPPFLHVSGLHSFFTMKYIKKTNCDTLPVARYPIYLQETQPENLKVKFLRFHIFYFVTKIITVIEGLLHASLPRTNEDNPKHFFFKIVGASGKVMKVHLKSFKLMPVRVR